MFEGLPDQFHQFIAARTSLPLPLSFPLHASPSPNTFTPYDLYDPSHQVPLQPTLLHPLHHRSPTHKDEEEKEETNLVSMNLEIERQRSTLEPVDPWSQEEVLALLRIRSSVENWLPEFTWEHVSRKLAELGFKRSAEKCKEKYEEESRYFNANINYGKSFRFLSELEELYHGDQNPQAGTEKNGKMDKTTEGEDNLGQSLEVDSRDGTARRQFEDSENVAGNSKNKKRKRKKKFEMLKGLCEKIVNKMMAQQEEMHNKLLEDMVKRDEEKIAKEEAWKKQEMDRLNSELEIMAQEQAIAGDRQTTIIELLKQYTSSSLGSHCSEDRHVQDSLKVAKSSNSYPPASSSLIQAKNPDPTCHINSQNTVEAPPSSSMDEGPQNSIPFSTQGISITPTSIIETLARQNPSASSTLPPASQKPNSLDTQMNNPLVPTSNLTQTTTNVKDDLGKRWPRDEVLALINLRCSLCTNAEEKESSKAPLWERISQGMLELGYKRSAKRCKEKWENINKYFRKTKHVNKKRSLDSRTCPYFHQLSVLYNQGTLVAPSEGAENRLNPSENDLALPEMVLTSSQGVSSNSTIHVAEGQKNMVQVSSFDFEF